MKEALENDQEVARSNAYRQLAANKTGIRLDGIAQKDHRGLRDGTKHTSDQKKNGACQKETKSAQQQGTISGKSSIEPHTFVIMGNFDQMRFVVDASWLVYCCWPLGFCFFRGVSSTDEVHNITVSPLVRRTWVCVNPWFSD